jgi:hypothetical protein
MQPWEGNHVDSQLPKVSIQLAREPEAGGHAGHGDGDQVVEVTIGRRAKLQSSANIVLNLL